MGPERLWREEGLQIPQRHRKRKRLYHKDSSVIRLRPRYQNHIWSIDFVHDKLANGRSYKMLTVLDEYSREALCVAVKPRMGNAEVLEALYPLFLKHGKPEFIRSDNGPEFIAENFQTWLTKVELWPEVDGAVKSRFLMRVGWVIIVHVYFTRPTDWGIV